ncbi:MAG: hypothetical protein NZL83_03275 [Candidatus Absconditabacterales bacterium]|nr:hypothetical protein [Candidatus Absconditabacterales bacterium]
MRLSFLACVMLGLALAGCWGGGLSSTDSGEPLSSGPIEEGMKVWVDYTITDQVHTGIVLDTTDAVVASGAQYPLTRTTFGPELITIVNGGLFADDIVQALIGKKPGDVVTVEVIPSLEKQALYDINNTASLPGELFDRAGITIRVGDVRVVDSSLGIVREIRGERPNHEIIVDRNDRSTYRPLLWTVTVRQIGGKKPE